MPTEPTAATKWLCDVTHPGEPCPTDGGYVVPADADPDDDGFRVRCDGMDGPLPCSKPAGHSGP